MNKKAIIAAVLIAILAIGGIVYALTSNPNAPKIVDSEPNSAQTSGDNATITFTDDGFNPETLTVKKGTTVTVINNASRSVKFSSADHPTHRENPELNMETLEPGEQGTFTPTTIGTHGFHDHLDEDKVGTLIVIE